MSEKPRQPAKCLMFAGTEQEKKETEAVLAMNLVNQLLDAMVGMETLGILHWTSHEDAVRCLSLLTFKSGCAIGTALGVPDEETKMMQQKPAPFISSHITMAQGAMQVRAQRVGPETEWMVPGGKAGVSTETPAEHADSPHRMLAREWLLANYIGVEEVKVFGEGDTLETALATSFGQSFARGLAKGQA